ncbi:MAG TPA: glutathione S-transferase family protein [Candidatus Polarisedimenticolia bacterium]|nr:glutathione S-transferase family protein [Candidatus Polarisedimenticolia bacterium]
MLTLHSFDRSPFGWKVRIVLAEKKVAHKTVVPENKNEDPAFARLNPFRLTPVLELGNGRTLYESTVIAEYLEEAYPDPAMLPRDPYERARIRLLEDTTDQYVYPTIRAFVSAQFEYQPPLLIRRKVDQVDHKGLEAARIKIHEHLARLEKELHGRTWFGGEIFSLADAALTAPLAGSLTILGLLPDPKYPDIAGWIRRSTARPTYREAAPKEPMRIKEG